MSIYLILSLFLLVLLLSILYLGYILVKQCTSQMLDQMLQHVGAISQLMCSCFICAWYLLKIRFGNYLTLTCALRCAFFSRTNRKAVVCCLLLKMLQHLRKQYILVRVYVYGINCVLKPDLLTKSMLTRGYLKEDEKLKKLRTEAVIWLKKYLGF
jgi:hypothetical protein